MYGLLLEAISDCIKSRYGLDTWEEICKVAEVGPSCFSTHEIYGEELIPNIAKAASSVLGESPDDIMDNFGVAFVSFVGQYGYDSILKVLGRNLRDFLNGLDNLHEYLRFSYPKLKPPSFFVENESRAGLTLHYRSRRRGYLHYVKGQIRRVGELFYRTKINIFVVDQTENPKDGTIHVKFRLLFDNIAYRDVARKGVDGIVDNIPLRSELLFELFPFHLVFGRKMEIRSSGTALVAVIPDIVGKQLPDLFFLTRPLTKLTWEEVLAHTNNVFVLVSKQLIKYDSRNDDEKSVTSEHTSKPHANTDDALAADEDHDDFSNRLHVKGQMMFMTEWEAIMFLGTPVMNNLDDMFNSGLYINDLSMHDSSRDLVLAGTQQSAELKLALDQEQEKSRLLGESMKKLDAEMKRTDALLYQMIPKPVADRLRRGEPSVATCQAFDSVTILFSDVVGFTTICSRITPMEVVSMLNAMYTAFDKLSETHDVYKVETIGDAYMAVAGAPTVTQFHAPNMCNMALDMLIAMTNLKDPSTEDNMKIRVDLPIQDHIKIRVGIHTGATVAGVVGLKMPRYCLFGDTVNTASRMETNGEAMKIHISETTRQQLMGYPFMVQERGEIEVKGKGCMKTYWLLDRQNSTETPKCPFSQLMEKEKQQHAQDRASLPHVSTHRPIYSPVSFDDLHAERRLSVGLTPQHSPSHGRGSEQNVRRGSKASAQLPGDGRGGTPPGLPPSSAGGANSSSLMSKPTQAVPPTRSGSCSPILGEKGAPESTSVDPKSPHALHKTPHFQENGLQNLHPKPSSHSESNATKSSVVNNNDKTLQDHSRSHSDNPSSLSKPFPSDKGGGGTSSGTNHTFGKTTSGSEVVKFPTSSDQGLAIPEAGNQKDSRTEKPKSKTCVML